VGDGEEAGGKSLECQDEEFLVSSISTDIS
jgi:hypothetical protein